MFYKCTLTKNDQGFMKVILIALLRIADLKLRNKRT